MKVGILVIAFLVALFVGFGVAYASNNQGGSPRGSTIDNSADSNSIPVTLGDTMVLVVGPSVGQYNCLSVTQSQTATQTATGTSTQSATSTGGSTTAGGPAGNLSLVGNVALGLQANLQIGTNINTSDMYTETAVGSFNRISRVKGGKGR
ncbi:hypothetical protein [Candidatus Caldatribacterium sp.]|uniref:hypothetical protein n=1 Tax=Candidatus Caldatribacterium sp. TaxID=2282143 RepID=UPI00299BDA56|nr:hypothetical protein [Candidatus Caldatribacterium sp.]MDW8081560.1 hypothetical protein [Candidatus Calescibacterium sp.]